ncbi:5-deoxy-glucuronate isomerase [Halobacillus sp. Cin3]|uniref:5-deoxy-glucuronate isomerase n=1 Tax=Halobacillus sp. Cin3 TaxID=2928441 RepID=UPI00248D9AD7|nr:5-deoxy-glucuronate isomerase [Halobacillus sp. Cin3]
MAELIVKSHKPDKQGKSLEITPEQAGWDHVGFEVFALKKGEELEKNTEDREVCLVLLSGRADVATNHQSFENIGERMDVFEWIPPYSVYLPPKERYHIQARTDLEVAVCSAPSNGNYEPRLISPYDVGKEKRGTDHLTRHIHNILPEDKPADSLLVVEVLTPQGSWSGFPPHKHDEENLPYESKLEETYYHKIQPESGFAFQRVYTDDRSLDENMIVNHNDAVMVPKGYHPVAAPPGHNVYFLNVMAGPERVWKFQTDPEHEWLLDHYKVY